MSAAPKPAATMNRVHNSVLAAAEKRFLIYLAGRLPAAVNSDHLTALSLLAMLGAGFAYSQAGSNLLWLWVVNAMLVLNWFGDSLDGTVARVRNKQRPKYGYYIDHVVDAFSAVFLFGGLAASGFMNPYIAVVVLVAYLLLSIESYLATYSRNIFNVSHFGFGPTELRILIIIGNLVLLGHAKSRESLFTIGGVIAAAGMIVVLLIATWRNGKALYDEETR